MAHYRHTQYLSGKTLALVVTVLLIITVAVLVPGAPAFAYWVFAGILLLLSQFAKLTVEIDRVHLSIRFGIGIVRKTIELADIAAAGAVSYPWYYGYGIRLTPAGWMYNVSGNEAVELELRSGKRFWVGTDEPQAFLRALPQSVVRKS